MEIASRLLNDSMQQAKLMHASVLSYMNYLDQENVDVPIEEYHQLGQLANELQQLIENAFSTLATNEKLTETYTVYGKLKVALFSLEHNPVILRVMALR